jgi:hypothetical protein
MRISKFLFGIIFLAGFTQSCSTDNNAEGNGGNESKAMTLKIRGASYGTRASGAEGTESSVKNLVIAVFDGTTLENTFVVSSPEVTGNTITKKITYKASTPKIVVVANVPASVFTGVKTADEFNVLTTSLDNTTSAYDAATATFTSAVGDKDNVGTQKSDVLPMIGTASAIDANGSSSVSLYRMVSRVSIGSIKTAFSEYGPYAGFTFKVEQVYMANVPSASTLASEWDANGGGSAAVTSSMVQGLTTNETDYKSYLGTGVLDAATPFTTNEYFYVFPNSSTTFSTQTKLVIKGQLYDKSGALVGTYYYPVVVNRAQTGTDINNSNSSDASHSGTGTVGANRTYTLGVTIMTKGNTNPDDDLKPTDLSISVTVSDWSSNLTQDVIFN